MSTREGIFLAGHENSWIASGSDVEWLVYFSEDVFAIGISLFSTAAAGYFMLLLCLVRPVTAWYARRLPG